MDKVETIVVGNPHKTTNEQESTQANNGYVVQDNQPKLAAVPLGILYKVYIYGLIEDPYSFVEAIDVLNNASEHDRVEVHLATPGGCVDAAIVFIHAINTCKATVVGFAEATVASAGVPIFLSCDSYVLTPYCTFMVHDGSFGSMQKTNEHFKHIVSIRKLLKKLYEETLYPAFDHGEIEEVLDGKDIYVDSEEMLERINNAVEIINNQKAEENETE